MTDFFEELKSKYPLMYERCDVWVDEGWQPIVLSLSRMIQSRIDWSVRSGNPIPQVTVEQIKEKFGGLRFYYTGGDDWIDGMVVMAEEWASYTCEVCGKPGHARSGGWIKTLCDEHDEERKARYGSMEISKMGSEPDSTVN